MNRLACLLALGMVSFAPSVSAPPPSAKKPSNDRLVTAYAQISGRTYHIVVGRQGGTRDQDGLWSAAFSTEEQRSDDAKVVMPRGVDPRPDPAALQYEAEGFEAASDGSIQ